jgi:GNAT superfamily N-acetyltransferase
VIEDEPVIWSPERKREVAIVAPMQKAYVRPDTRIVERRGWVQVITPSAHGFLNEICLSQVDTGDAERAIDEAIETYGALGLPFAWTLGPWTRPLDFAVRLRRRGFTSTRALGMGAPPDLRVEVPAGIDVREVADDATLEAFIACSAEGWAHHERELAAERASHAALLSARPQRVRLWLAEIDGRGVGTAVTVLFDDHGYLMGAQVLAPHRRRGVYRALVAARLAQLRELGHEYAVTLGGVSTSAPALARMGFDALYDAEVFRIDPTPRAD